MPTLSNLPEVGLAMLGFHYSGTDSASSRLFAPDHDQESIGQMVIVEQQGGYRYFARFFQHLIKPTGRSRS